MKRSCVLYLPGVPRSDGSHASCQGPASGRSSQAFLEGAVGRGYRPSMLERPMLGRRRNGRHEELLGDVQERREGSQPVSWYALLAALPVADERPADPERPGDL